MAAKAKAAKKAKNPKATNGNMKTIAIRVPLADFTRYQRVAKEAGGWQTFLVAALERGANGSKVVSIKRKAK